MRNPSYFFASNTNVETINAKDIISIGDSVFADCTDLVSCGLLTENSNLAEIGFQGFFRCKKLANVVFPTKLTSIKGEAFAESILKSAEGKQFDLNHLTHLSNKAFWNAELQNSDGSSINYNVLDPKKCDWSVKPYVEMCPTENGVLFSGDELAKKKANNWTDPSIVYPPVKNPSPTPGSNSAESPVPSTTRRN